MESSDRLDKSTRHLKELEERIEALIESDSPDMAYIVALMDGNAAVAGGKNLTGVDALIIIGNIAEQFDIPPRVLAQAKLVAMVMTQEMHNTSTKRMAEGGDIPSIEALAREVIEKYAMSEGGKGDKDGNKEADTNPK